LKERQQKRTLTQCDDNLVCVKMCTRLVVTLSLSLTHTHTHTHTNTHPALVVVSERECMVTERTTVYVT
jgi:NAD-dependent dihydropyrimidine dehydrogenase PreA subunit